MTNPKRRQAAAFFVKSLWSWRPLRPASWQVLARRERAAAGRGAPIADSPKGANRSLLVYGHRRDVDHAQTGLAQTRRFLLLFQSAAPPAALSAASLCWLPRDDRPGGSRRTRFSLFRP